MKSIATILSLLVITGCSMTPRVGDKSGAYYPITLNAKSSEALIALSKTSIKGVRDLSVGEFENESVTVKEFEELNSEIDNPMSSEAYALGSVAVGASLGLAFKYASGVGVLGYLASDDRPKNYEFSDDFNSTGYIYSPKGSDTLFGEMVKAIPDAMLSFNEKVDSIFKIGMEDELHVFPLPASKNSKDDYQTHIFEAFGSVGSVKNGKKIVTQFFIILKCKSKISQSAICSFQPRFTIDRNNHPLISLLIKEIAQVMPEGSLMYLPPRKDLNRIPMVYKADGKPMYLVEKK